MERPLVRDVSELFWLYLSCARQWPGIPDRSRLCVGWSGSGERGDAGVHGVPELFSQRRYAGTERRCPGATCE
jgi:hypothetical protein